MTCSEKGTICRNCSTCSIYDERKSNINFLWKLQLVVSNFVQIQIKCSIVYQECIILLSVCTTIEGLKINGRLSLSRSHIIGQGKDNDLGKNNFIFLQIILILIW